MVADDPESFADLDGHVNGSVWGDCEEGQICSFSRDPESTATNEANSGRTNVSYISAPLAGIGITVAVNTASAQNTQGNTGASVSTTPYVAPGTADARNAVLAILNSNNACSLFFNPFAALLPGAGGASAAQIFSAVDIRVFSDGSSSPAVAAQSIQSSGTDGPIIINPSGAFFNPSGIVNYKITD
jgi:hypothetical protein